MKHFLIYISFISLLTSCSFDADIEYLSIDYGYEYYPAEIGKYIIYDVDSITFDLTSNGRITDTTSYQVKEEIADTTTDNAGRSMYIIHHSTRDNPNEDWTIKKVHTTVIDDNRVEKTEDNFRFVKMLFPVQKETTWNGNQLFSDDNVIITVRGETLELFKNWTSSVIDKNVSTVINNQTFDDVLMIYHADYENNIERRFVEEKYARNIGLISKTMIILDTQCNGNLANCIGMPWEDKAEKGFILHQRIKAHN